MYISYEHNNNKRTYQYNTHISRSESRVASSAIFGGVGRSDGHSGGDGIDLHG